MSFHHASIQSAPHMLSAITIGTDQMNKICDDHAYHCDNMLVVDIVSVAANDRVTVQRLRVTAWRVMAQSQRKTA